jgi:hypothetical protein
MVPLRPHYLKMKEMQPLRDVSILVVMYVAKRRITFRADFTLVLALGAGELFRCHCWHPILAYQWRCGFEFGQAGNDAIVGVLRLLMKKIPMAMRVRVGGVSVPD